ncbi:MAG TPA: hypothetical protein VNG69_02470 [Casimicrobiaceae bacterium]|nr:hypothetical protein [Casimicrobiaceae bacterium]
MNAPSLDDRLHALSGALANQAPPASVDRAIAAAIASSQRRARRPSRERWLAWPLALAASIFAISLIVRQMPGDEHTQLARGAALHEVGRSFIPVVASDVIERAGDAYVVPARFPRTALAQFGFPFNPQRVDESIDAELLVRADGALLAFRFVD